MQGKFESSKILALLLSCFMPAFLEVDQRCEIYKVTCPSRLDQRPHQCPATATVRYPTVPTTPTS